MRHQYTPIFRDLLTSSLWATATPATKVVWLTLLLDADPEGYVPVSVPGLAMRAGVTLEEVKIALDLLEGPDAYSRTKTNGGRRVEAVDHGFHILNFVDWRARAVAESEKARKRHWARAHRQGAANDNAGLEEQTSTCSGSSETLDAPKPKPLPKPKTKKEKRDDPPPSDTLGVVYTNMDGYEPPQWLIDEAMTAGIPRTWFDERLVSLSTGPIGGARGVSNRDTYVRSHFPAWRRWWEREQLKAQRDAAGPPSSRFGKDPGGQDTGARATGWGKHLGVRERELCTTHRLDPAEAVRNFLKTGAADSCTHGEADAMFRRYVQAVARARKAS